MIEYTYPPVKTTTYQRVLKLASDFGMSFDDVVNDLAAKVEGMQSVTTGTQMVVDAMEYANSVFGVPHGPEGLLSIPANSPYHLRVGRNVMLPIGTLLKARFKDRDYEAMVTPAGIGTIGAFYNTPTAAAVALKLALGIDRKAAQTNGWMLWTYEDPPGSGVWSPLAKLREYQIGPSIGSGDEE